MKTIILVDDENINHILAKRILSGSYRLLSAYSGEEALRMLEEETADLLFMDILMPEMDGFETFGLMKERGSQAEVPVVFLTSKEDESMKARCLKAGAAAYITKPFVPDELKRTIRDILRE